MAPYERDDSRIVLWPVRSNRLPLYCSPPPSPHESSFIVIFGRWLRTRGGWGVRSHRHQDKHNPPLYKARMGRHRWRWGMVGIPVSTYGRPKQRDSGRSNRPMVGVSAAKGAMNACATLEKSLS